MKTNAVHVAVSGDNPVNVNAAVAIATSALREHGFQEVSVVNHISGEPVPADDVMSVMDLVRANHPSLFHAPITISGEVFGGTMEAIIDEGGLLANGDENDEVPDPTEDVLATIGINDDVPNDD